MSGTNQELIAARQQLEPLTHDTLEAIGSIATHSYRMLHRMHAQQPSTIRTINNARRRQVLGLEFYECREIRAVYRCSAERALNKTPASSSDSPNETPVTHIGTERWGWGLRSPASGTWWLPLPTRPSNHATDITLVRDRSDPNSTTTLHIYPGGFTSCNRDLSYTLPRGIRFPGLRDDNGAVYDDPQDLQADYARCFAGATLIVRAVAAALEQMCDISYGNRTEELTPIALAWQNVYRQESGASDELRPYPELLALLPTDG